MSVKEKYLIPEKDTLRALFLYVGQGESTLLFIPDTEGGHITMLVDCNSAPKVGGIDLAKLLVDALPLIEGADDEKRRLQVFINTHPHSDHLGGLEAIREKTKIEEIWHSGHKPSKDHDAAYRQLLDLIEEVEDAGGTATEMQGSRTGQLIGQALVHVVSPAQYVKDDIADEKPKDRDKRIHEQCAVLRILYGTKEQKSGVLLTGDSDKAAWKNHICAYHGEGEENRVNATVLSASHHGSRTFFKDTEDDEEVYTDHLAAIAPQYVVVSAPDSDDSPHGHPHDDALELYETAVGKNGICHMGSRQWSFILDVSADGNFELYSDRGEIAEEYGFQSEESSDQGGGGKASKAAAPMVISRVEHSRPMGSK